MRFHTYADKQAVLDESPDVVVVASGGVPDLIGFDDQAGGRAVSTWEVLSGEWTATAPHRVLIFDDQGSFNAVSCAEHIAEMIGGANVEIVTPDRRVAEEMGALNWPVFLRNLYTAGVKMTPDSRVLSVKAAGERCLVRVQNEYSGEWSERRVDTVVVEHGTIPCDELYHELVPLSRNAGQMDLNALVEDRAQPIGACNPEASFELFRVGDAVSSRNIHAAIYDSLRLCKHI